MTTTSGLSQDTINAWADDPKGPVALCLKQKLIPVEGEGGVIFPPTYADIGYNIDTLSDGTKVATIDSVGSQANRIEPIFKASKPGETANPLSQLVPQINITYGDGKSLSIFDAGHRIGDAIIRASDLKDDARKAFEAYLDTGNATPMAQLAPTSIVFGVWDSRDTQGKFPRLVQSIIRAWDVTALTRAAQYNPAIDYSATEVFSEDDKAKSEGNPKSPRAQRGFVHVPSTGVPGGVVAKGPIERTTTVNLIALRRLEGDNAKALRRHILGLCLVAAASPLDGFLRQGCLLTMDPAEPGKWESVGRDGVRVGVSLTNASAFEYALAASKTFGIGPDRSVAFKKDLAVADLQENEKKKSAKGAKAKGRQGKESDPKGSESDGE